jgi:hypothetical protein
MRGLAVSGIGIVNLPFRPVEGRTQINASRRITAPGCRARVRDVPRIRNCKRARDRFMVSRVQIVPKDKQLVLENRPSERPSKVVVGEMPELAADVLPRIQIVVLNKFKCRPVQRIRA